MTLAELQHAFWSLTAATQRDRALDPDRLFGVGSRPEIYRHMFLERQLDVLRDDFSKLLALLGATEFAALARRYLEAHPSSHHSLARLGHAFATFLLASAGARPDLADLARLEWARVEVIDEADVALLAQPLSLDQPLAFIHALRSLNLRYDVVAVWRALEAGEPAPPARVRQDVVVVWRKQSNVYHVRLAADEAAAFERAANGASLACVCEAFAERPDPARAAFHTLSSWFWEGWIAAP